MTLYASLSVGTTPIGTAVIDNIGHPDNGTHPTDDDLRMYEYDVMMLGVCTHDCPHGTVTHRRSDGAWRLVKAVLDDCCDRLPGYDHKAHPPITAQS